MADTEKKPEAEEQKSSEEPKKEPEKRLVGKLLKVWCFADNADSTRPSLPTLTDIRQMQVNAKEVMLSIKSHAQLFMLKDL